MSLNIADQNDGCLMSVRLVSRHQVVDAVAAVAANVIDGDESDCTSSGNINPP